MAHQVFQYDRYTLRKKVLKILGESLTISGPDGSDVLRAEMKAFKLKESITLFDSAGRFPMLQINARSMFDFGSTYDVIEVGSGDRVGSLRRMAMRSMVRDEWKVLDPTGAEVGSIFEDNVMMALLRRYIGIIPQSFHFEHAGLVVASFTQHFNPFVLKMDLDFTSDAREQLDRRLGIAAAVLLVLIEGRQDSA